MHTHTHTHIVAQEVRVTYMRAISLMYWLGGGGIMDKKKLVDDAHKALHVSQLYNDVK